MVRLILAFDLVDAKNNCRHVIEEANHLAPTFARLFKEMIIVADPQRPIPRAAKGTINRRQAYILYEQEIDKLYVPRARMSFLYHLKVDIYRYQTVADSADTKGISAPKTWTVSDIEQWLLAHTRSLKPGQEISIVRSVFEQGFDRYRN